MKGAEENKVNIINFIWVFLRLIQRLSEENCAALQRNLIILRRTFPPKIFALLVPVCYLQKNRPFLKNHECQKLSDDRDGKIIESIDLEYLSSRAYFMGNPVAAILLRFNHSAILLPLFPGFRLCWKPFLVRWLSGISISVKFPHSVCPLAHSLGPVTPAALFNHVYLASLTSGPDSLPSRGGMYGQWAADLVGKKGGVGKSKLFNLQVLPLIVLTVNVFQYRVVKIRANLNVNPWLNVNQFKK